MALECDQEQETLMALDERKGIWKSGKGKGRHTPKGRQLDDSALAEVQAGIASGAIDVLERPGS